MPEPGWYADPHEAGRLRWWDGSAWTHHSEPDPNAAPPTVPPPAPWVPPSTSPPGPVPGPASSPGWYPPGPTATPEPAWGPAPWSPPVPRPPVRRNPWVLIGSIAAALVLFGIVLVVLFALVGGDDTSSSSASAGADLSNPLAGRAAEAGIPVLGSEGSVTHTHTLVRIEVDGRDVTIPAFIGIDAFGGRIAAVHTHEDKGVVHVESPHDDDHYTLGQFLTLWGAGSTDEQLCDFFASTGCQVDVSVVDPTAADRRTFGGFGPMPDIAETPARGLDTELDQGAVIVVSITTPAHA